MRKNGRNFERKNIGTLISALELFNVKNSSQIAEELTARYFKNGKVDAKTFEKYGDEGRLVKYAFMSYLKTLGEETETSSFVPI